MKPINYDELRNFVATRIDTDWVEYPNIHGDMTIRVPAEMISVFVKLMVDERNNLHLSAITAQIRKEQEDDIELIYHFWQGTGFSLMTTIPITDPHIHSLVFLIPGADFYEREVAEMFGVIFTGRRETPPLLLSNAWNQGPPFRIYKGDEK